MKRKPIHNKHRSFVKFEHKSSRAACDVDHIRVFCFRGGGIKDYEFKMTTRPLAKGVPL